MISERLPLELSPFSECHGVDRGAVVILASGPSSSNFVVDQCPFPIIAMNGSILKFKGCVAKPYFYICDDPFFVKNKSDLLAVGMALAENVAFSRRCYQEAAVRALLFPDTCRYFLLERVNRKEGSVRLSNRRYAWSIRKDPDLLSGFSLFRSKPNRVGFSRNMSKGYFGARTIAYAAVQLACHLGFSSVYMVGVDLDPRGGRFYKEVNPLQTTLAQDFDDYIFPSFVFLAERVVNIGKFQVFNASDVSRLPTWVIPQVKLAELQR